MPRLNNRAARNIVNRWLVSTGRDPFPETVPYIEAANRLRAEFHPEMSLFVERPEAVAFLREFARGRF